MLPAKNKNTIPFHYIGLLPKQRSAKGRHRLDYFLVTLISAVYIAITIGDRKKDSFWAALLWVIWSADRRDKYAESIDHG